MTAHDPVDAAKKGLGNSYKLSNISQYKPNIFVNGATKYDKFITVDNSRIFSNTGAHEMGHALGMDHASEGIMTPTSNDENRSRPIPQENIDQMIEHATEVIIINTWFEALKNFFK